MNKMVPEKCPSLSKRKSISAIVSKKLCMNSDEFYKYQPKPTSKVLYLEFINSEAN